MATEITIPAVGESITEVTIASWHKNDGDYVEEDEVICEVDSDKATFEINAEEAGVLNIKVGEGETVNVGDSVGTIDTSAEAPAKEKKEEKSPAAEEQTASAAKEEPASGPEETSHAEGHPSPAAAKILQENGLTPDQVKGTGKGGRITKEDAQKAAEEKQQAPEPAKEAPKKEEPAKKQATDQPEPEPEKPVDGASRQVRREKMTTLRKTIATRMVETKNKTAMLTTFNEVDMTELKKIRSKYKEQFKEKHEANLGFMSFFTKAVCLALQEFPEVNAQIDGDQIIYHDYCDVGIAVSTPRGLVVPVIRNAESLSIAQLEREIIRLATKGRDGKISIEEMQGGTFTITNGGVFGSMLSTPIINDPQSAILGMHNIVDRPVAVNGQVEVRPIMYVAVSYDHRIIDGKESVSFLYRVKEYIEDPNRLLLGV